MGCDTPSMEAPAGSPLGPFEDVLARHAATIPWMPVIGRSPDPFTYERPMVGDLDGDGLREVHVYHDATERMADDAALAFEWDPASRALVAIPPPAGLGASRSHPIAAIADLDGDGRDDVLFREPVESAFRWNEGGRFSAAPLSARFAGTNGVPRATSALGLGDLDSDGWIDVIVGLSDARCSGVEVYLQRAPRTFEPLPLRFDGVPNLPRVLALHALPGQGERADLFVLGASCSGFDGDVEVATPWDAPWHPRSWFPVESVGCNQSAGAPPLRSIAQTSPMGTCAGDIDGDGRIDRIITGVGIDTALGTDDGPMRRPPSSAGLGRYLGPNGVAMIPWGAAIVDLDRDGRNDVVTTFGLHTGPVSPGEADVGAMHTVLLRNVTPNGGALRFENATEGSGAGARGHWHSLSLTDIDDDGRADLAVAGLGQHAMLLRDRGLHGGNGLSLRLRGSTSNPLGLGAHVQVRAVDGAPWQHLWAGAEAPPSIVAEPIVFAGVGDAPRAASVRVTWPSGLVQEWTDLEAGRRHVLEEAETVHVTPESRISRDGFVVTVIGRGPRGDRRAAAFSLSAEGAIVTPIDGADPTSRQWRLTPAPGAGEAVVTAVIDGRTVAVHPRLHFVP